MVTFRPMTDDEYIAYDEYLWEDYAQVRARNAHHSIEEERADVAKQRASLLPNGLHTPQHFFWQVIDATEGIVGHLWVHVDDTTHRAFIYDIEMAPAFRGRGYGQQTLTELDRQLKPLGVTAIALNVFGDNDTAMRLYQRSGYRVVATSMQKEL